MLRRCNEVQNRNEISHQLCQNTIFEGLTSEQITGMWPCIVAYVKNYGSQECVCRKGETVRDLGVVLDGELRVCNERADGKRVTVASIQKNQLLGEAVMFSTTSCLPHLVIAQRSAQVLYLSKNFFLTPCDKAGCAHKSAHQDIVKNMLRLLSDQAIYLNQKIAYLTATDLKTKVAMYLWELYESNNSKTFNMPLNRGRLAEFFAVARPSLSRELINLKNLGVIDFYRSSVKILDLKALDRLAHRY